MSSQDKVNITNHQLQPARASNTIASHPEVLLNDLQRLSSVLRKSLVYEMTIKWYRRLLELAIIDNCNNHWH